MPDYKLPVENITYCSPDHEELCFRHAVFVAMSGLHIEARIADKPLRCVHCEEDAVIINLRKKAWLSKELRRKVR